MKYNKALLCITTCHSVIANSVWPHGLHSLPSSIVLGILQGRALEWAAIPFARGSSWPRNQTQSPILPADSLPCQAPQVWNLHSFSDVWRELQVVGLGHCSLVLLSGKGLQVSLTYITVSSKAVFQKNSFCEISEMLASSAHFDYPKK